MANTGLLFVSNVVKAQFYQNAGKYIQKVLYIKVHGKTENNLSTLSNQIFQIYSKAPNNLDVRLILKPNNSIKKIKTYYPVDLILYDRELKQETLQSLESVKTGCETKIIDFDPVPIQEVEDTVKSYEYVAVGGTFDRLHNGHKILLSEAALRTTKRLTVGVTDVNMIQSKKLWELIEPVDQRIQAVLNFLTDINPEIEYNVLPIQDVYGPTKDDPQFQLIVVSEETQRGAVKVNEKRAEKGLNSLDVHVIGLAEDSSPQRSQEEEAKVSSSNRRMRMLGTILRPPVPNPQIPESPYVIGLAGGIAAGKSNIAEKLKAKGAAIVNCDIIAHELYKPGLPLNSTISQTFGQHVITDAGEVDRRKLGEIVFSDPTQLEKLNNILWPAILEEAKRQVTEFGKEGYRVVVMEAAVMVRAQWYRHCHQLWAVIIPPEEAVKRLQKRNNLSEDEARKRIGSQPSNLEQVSLANIVFSPYWSYEYTQKQIDRAWDQLQMYLKNKSAL